MAIKTGTNNNNILNGGSGADELYGLGGDDQLNGKGGNDLLDGGSGNDTLNGGAGADTVYASSGADVAEGGAGVDTLVVDFSASTSSVGCWGYQAPPLRIMDSEGNSVTATGFEKLELHSGSGNDQLYGIEGENRIFSGGGNDWIEGRGKNDVLYGEAGNDYIQGGNGKDQISGGEGNDTLDGGAGADTITGGVGADHFYFTAPTDGVKGEVISDFEVGAGGDMLDFSSLKYYGLMQDAQHLRFTQFDSNGDHIADSTRVAIDVTGESHFTDLVTLQGSLMSLADADNLFFG